MAIEFSAIVHTYNRAHFLPKALTAIQNQTYPASEYILVDDGSQDDTETVAKHDFPEFKYVRIENVGSGGARKVGAETATKEWLAFCDDDDLWLDTHLECRKQLIERFPEAGFTCSNFGSFGDASERDYSHFQTAPDGWWTTATEVEDGPFRLLNTDTFRNSLKFNPAFPLVWAVRREIYWDVGGIDRKYSRGHAEDTAFSRKMFLSTRTACDFRITAMYHRHGANATTVKFMNYSRRADILEGLLTDGAIPEVYSNDATEWVATSRKQAFLHAYWSGYHQEALEIYDQIPREYKDFGLAARMAAATVMNRWCSKRGKRP